LTRIIEGKPNGRGLRFALVVSRFNSVVTDKLLEGALQAMNKCGVAEEDVEVVRVPGSFEIPLTAKKLAQSGRFAGVVCLGAIIRGETPHWDYLAHAVAEAIAKATLESGVPLSLGVLTTDSRELALARAVPGGNNRGYDAAVTAIEMADLLRTLEGRGND
jgi:6,7-dimethyl-8-ribityllumazine synthase